MNFLSLLKSKSRSRPAQITEQINLHAIAVLFEERVTAALQGISDPTKRRKVERRVRREITGHLEKIVLQIVKNERPDLVLEIGAHAAEFSKLAKIASPGSKCIAFEGNPKVFERFANDLEQVAVDYVPICLSDRRTELTFHVPLYQDALMDSMGSVRQYKETISNKDPHAEYIVQAIPLDEYLLNSKSKSNVMWIDVEGAVGDVLKGAENSLRNCLALYLEVEAEPRWSGQTFIDRHAYDFLTNKGFVPILRDVQRRKWQYNILYVHERIAQKDYLVSAAKHFLNGGAPL